MGKKDKKFPEESSGKYEQSGGKDDNKTVPASVKKYKIVFKHNRSKELFVGRTKLVFGPYGEETVSESFRNHKDFLTQEKYFNIMEVK